MYKILIFAGTTEGRQLAQYFNDRDVPVHVCVATAYGEMVMPKGGNIQISSDALSIKQMESLMRERKLLAVVDATHPYAAQVSDNIRQACEHTGFFYHRLLRPTASVQGGNCHYVASPEDAVQYLESTKGNILLTNGSKELSKFTLLSKFQERCYARVLASAEGIQACTDAGLEGSHIIAMQGPFLEELNFAILKQYNISYMITKDSGQNGGFEEKTRAAEKAGIPVVVIGRPVKENGESFIIIKDRMRRLLRLNPVRIIQLAGIGMGKSGTMTQEVKDACSNADLLIGANRMVQSMNSFGKSSYTAFQPQDIVHYIKEHPEYEKIVVMLSGDTGFYSGAKKIKEALEELQIQGVCDISYLCGVPSVVYFCSRLQIPWEDVSLLSLHGKEGNFAGAIRNNRKTFLLLGGKWRVDTLCMELLAYGFPYVSLWIGENLSYPNEKIHKISPSDAIHNKYDPLSVVLIENPKGGTFPITPGLPDNKFIRGKVPMTKCEVRTIILSKLGLYREAICYDIGAGTGSISIEMAFQADRGYVYAIEKNAEALELIVKNKKKLGAVNMVLIHGSAPEIMEGMPIPTHAFIGGTTGNLEKIIEKLLQMNENIHIVLSAITLETVTEAVTCLKKFPFLWTDIVQVHVSGAKEVGDYHMMQGQNPVYIITARGGKKEE